MGKIVTLILTTGYVLPYAILWLKAVAGLAVAALCPKFDSEV